MTSPLHKVPIGLLELFRLRTLGRAPDKFGDTVFPVVDGLETYAAAELQTALGQPNVGAINGVGGLQQSTNVGTFQWIWGLGGVLTIGAAPGTFFTWHVGVLVPSTNSACILGTGELRPIGAGTTIRFGIALPRALVLRAGSAWFVEIHGDAAGADHSVTPASLFVPAANLV